MSDTAPAKASVAAQPKKPRQGRSPGFPFIPLGKALDRAESFRVAEGGRPRHFAPRSSAAAAWGMGVKTGPFLQTLAALGHFELMEFQGGGENRTGRLTETALRILLDKQPISEERDALIRQVALAPKIHAELWQKWGDALPSNATLETYLVRDRAFSESGARDLIAEYKDTVAFAKLGQPQSVTPAMSGEVKSEEEKPQIAVGDLIQLEIGGAFVLPTPERVRAIQEHEGRLWVFVENHLSGELLERAVLIEKAAPLEKTPTKPPVLPFPDKARESADHNIQPAAGEREWLRGPLSREATYRLFVSGEVGPKEIGKLIKVLKAQQAILSDDDEETGAD